VIDPRCEAVLILDRKTGQFQDKTGEVSGYKVQIANGTIDIIFNGGRVFRYGSARVRILRDPEQVALAEGARVEVRGHIWASATEVVTFKSLEGAWCRIFYRKQGGEVDCTYPASQVRIVTSATHTPAVADVMGYWRAIVARLPGDDPLVRPYDKLDFLHPGSVLGSYLAGASIEARELTAAPIFPFRCNLSQRTAVENGLTRAISVIEGPPGTGKTETILNLIANIIAVQHRTVGVVAYGNTAVDNVREKLDELGFGHMIANLGHKEKRPPRRPQRVRPPHARHQPCSGSCSRSCSAAVSRRRAICPSRSAGTAPKAPTR
jgi:hypothetical protein